TVRSSQAYAVLHGPYCVYCNEYCLFGQLLLASSRNSGQTTEHGRIERTAEGFQQCTSSARVAHCASAKPWECCAATNPGHSPRGAGFTARSAVPKQTWRAAWQHSESTPPGSPGSATTRSATSSATTSPNAVSPC